MERTPFTVEGYERLKKELDTLERVERAQVIKAIELARAHGDLSENAEYDAAKERQSHVEGRIQYLHSKLDSADVIDCKDQNSERVVFGVRVKLENVDNEEECVYRLVGPDESDIKEGRISIRSPLGQALIGKYEGDEITIRTPGGIRNYEILEIFV
ncbi:MAG: transcription elongation factor GreA [Nitrospiraceae bacterium]|nr:transcription elongation factor GreA [Nitrospiraceae bacterium]